MSSFRGADRSRFSELLSFIVRSQQVEECLFLFSVTLGELALPS